MGYAQCKHLRGFEEFALWLKSASAPLPVVMAVVLLTRSAHSRAGRLPWWTVRNEGACLNSKFTSCFFVTLQRQQTCTTALGFNVYQPRVPFNCCFILTQYFSSCSPVYIYAMHSSSRIKRAVRLHSLVIIRAARAYGRLWSLIKLINK